MTGTGDLEGWHLLAASSGDGWRWHALATLRPGGSDSERWIGQQCVTGDGRFVIAVVAPWHANNSGPGMDRGGMAYAVDAHTGRVRPLASGVSLAYFNPGCGIGDRVALTTYFGAEERTTAVTVLDASTGSVLRSSMVPGELTSAIPLINGIAGVHGQLVVRVSGTRQTALAWVPGQAFDMRPNSAGGADLLVAQGRVGSVWQLTRAGARKVASGRLAQVQLFAGRDGHNLVTGTGPIAGGGLTRLRAPSGAPPAAVSLGGQMTLPRPLAARLPRPVTQAITTFPSLDLAGHPGRRAATRKAGSIALAGAPAANTTTPTCAVPRNDLWTQVPQPNSAQIQWAVQQAVNGWLVPGNTPARPGDPQNYMIGDTQRLRSFYPSQDFPPPAIAGDSGAVVPPQVMYGILAQESNWNQASWHAPAGYSGNPLVANYYGSTDQANPTDINYDKADCGYGIAQITDLMNAGAADINTQTAIAVDYAENIAAGVTNLVGKWNQLAALGDVMNNGDPGEIENWYAAIWGYNSGVHSTTRGDPGNGLGWLNNPANPIYPANRHPFLCSDSSCTSYSDASHPQDWPYQEKVFGWIEGGQYDPNKPGSLRFTPLGSALTIPPINTFCSRIVNNCNPAMIGTRNPCPPTAPNCTRCPSGDASCDPCPAENSACWWNQPVTWASCPAQCTSGSFTNTYAGQPEPGSTARGGIICDAASQLPPSALIVADTALSSQNPQDLDPNAVGCPTTASWTAGGSFTLTDSSGLALRPSDAASIDLHQIGTGFGGHAWFTHTRPASDVFHEVIGTWSPKVSAAGIYQIEAFVPSPGATTTAATYIVAPNGLSNTRTYLRTINQNNYNNQWVSLGLFPLQPGASVSLGSVTPSSDPSQGADIAFSAIAFIPVPTGSYVALGDSYSSGEGSGGPWEPGTDVQGTTSFADGAQHDDLCHRSPGNYATQYAQMTRTFAGNAVDLTCSGATMQDLDNIHWIRTPDGTVYFDSNNPYQYPATPSACSGNPNPCAYSYDVQGPNGYAEPASQVDLLRQIPALRLVTVTLGGDDAGFANIITKCVTTYLADLATGTTDTCRQDYFTNPDGSDKLSMTIHGLQAPITKALEDIKAAVPTSATVVLLTYPDIFNSNSAPCADIGASDIDWLMQRAHEFDQVLNNAAATAGVSLLDEEHTFQGHELCTRTPWVQEPEIFSTNPLDPNRSIRDNFFHPLQPGYAQEAADLYNYLGIP